MMKKENNTNELVIFTVYISENIYSSCSYDNPITTSGQLNNYDVPKNNQSLVTPAVSPDYDNPPTLVNKQLPDYADPRQVTPGVSTHYDHPRLVSPGLSAEYDHPRLVAPGLSAEYDHPRLVKPRQGADYDVPQAYRDYDVPKSNKPRYGYDVPCSKKTLDKTNTKGKSSYKYMSCRISVG